MKNAIRCLIVAMTLVMAFTRPSSAVDAPAPDAQAKAKAVQSTKLALELARGSLEKKQFVDAVQLSDLADRCAQATGDAEFLKRTQEITAGLRAQCPPESVKEARAIIRELTAGMLETMKKEGAPGGAVKADPSRKKATEFKIEQGRLILPSPIVFGAGNADLAAESEPVLWFIADFLEARPLITMLRIEGHTDNAPAAASQSLSERRALAVANGLIARGVDAKRLLPVGFGATKPVADNATPEGKAANRRIEIRPAALRGKLIGNQPADGGGKVAPGWEK